MFDLAWVRVCGILLSHQDRILEDWAQECVKAAESGFRVVETSRCVLQINLPSIDGISSLSFCPKANYLVATSWDNQVNIPSFRVT